MPKMQPTRFIFVRHGQTINNEKKQLSGHTDVPLNDVGLAQAKAAGQMLTDVKIDKIISSPFLRALQTAEQINKGRDLEIQRSDGLKEQDFGDWEGKTFDEIDQFFPGGLKGLLRGPFVTRFPSGEGTETFISRVIGAFRDDVMPDSEGKTVAVVTHSGVIVTLLCHFVGLDPFTHFFRFHIENGSASAIDRYGNSLYRIMYINRVPQI